MVNVSSPMEPILILILISLISMCLIAVFGVIPPVLVGFFAYLQGKRGLDVAIHSRNVAYERLDDIMADVDSFSFRLDEMVAMLKEKPAIKMPVIRISDEELDRISSKIQIHIPEEEIDKLRKSVINGVKGSIGNLIGQVNSTVEGEVRELATDIQDNMTDEERSAMVVANFKNTLWKKAQSYLNTIAE